MTHESESCYNKLDGGGGSESYKSDHMAVEEMIQIMQVIPMSSQCWLTVCDAGPALSQYQNATILRLKIKMLIHHQTIRPNSPLFLFKLS